MTLRALEDPGRLRAEDPAMSHTFTLEYWPDDGGFVGRLREVPGVFSQGETLAELEDNIRDAYALVIEDESTDRPANAAEKLIEVAV